MQLEMVMMLFGKVHELLLFLTSFLGVTFFCRPYRSGFEPECHQPILELAALLSSGWPLTAPLATNEKSLGVCVFPRTQ